MTQVLGLVCANSSQLQCNHPAAFLPTNLPISILTPSVYNVHLTSKLLHVCTFCWRCGIYFQQSQSTGKHVCHFANIVSVTIPKHWSNFYMDVNMEYL